MLENYSIVVTRYFVEIIAQSKQALVGLQKLELDLFQPTSKAKVDENKFTIEGLITLDDVGRLVEKGYKVLVKKQSTPESPATLETTSFRDWVGTTETRLRDVKERDSASFVASSPGYLTTEGIDAAIQHIAKLYPSLVQTIVLPHKTHEDRRCRAVKISADNAATRSGMLFLGGVHAREIVNPDALVNLALNLCHAYTTNMGLTLGGKSYDAKSLKQIVESLDLYIFPLVNPDGRAFVQAPNGDVWWRKNRNPNPGFEYQGVDLNRNYDFLWSSGIGTSSNPATEIYKGKQPSSEPETRNVIHLINDYQNINRVIDVHSYSELILYPWGDDENQTEDPDMNFKNPSYDGHRGHPGDSIYQEYIHKKDLEWYHTTGNRIRDAIAAVRGTIYQVQPSMNLYPTSATCHDFIYSLRYNGANRDIMAFTIETAKRFQPPFSEAMNIMSEISAGLLESCLVSSNTQEP